MLEQLKKFGSALGRVLFDSNVHYGRAGVDYDLLAFHIVNMSQVKTWAVKDGLSNDPHCRLVLRKSLTLEEIFDNWALHMLWAWMVLSTANNLRSN